MRRRVIAACLVVVLLAGGCLWTDRQFWARQLRQGGATFTVMGVGAMGWFAHNDYHDTEGWAGVSVMLLGGIAMWKYGTTLKNSSGSHAQLLVAPDRVMLVCEF